MPPFVVAGPNGRPAGVGVCRHLRIPDDALEQVWGTATRLELTPALPEPDASAALDALLGQWRDHLAALSEASGATGSDSAAVINWPSRDVSGINVLLRHGMQPLTVLAVRAAGRPAATSGIPPGVVIREARLSDLDAVTELEMGVIRFDAQFGTAIMRPATEALVRQDTHKALTDRPDWAWVAERENFTTKERYCDFRSLYVAPGRRGTGAAFALLNACLDYCEINGLSRIVGRTSAENEAMQALYRRYGFAPKHIVFERRVGLPPGKPRPKVSEPRRPADPPRPTGGETRYRRRPGSRSS